MILVTGGTGLLGSNLLVKLATLEKEIIALYQTKSKIENVKKLFQFYYPSHSDEFFSKIAWVNCDILDLVKLEEQIKKCDRVYHCAALVSFRRRDFSDMMKINVQGTANVVNLCLSLKVKKLVYVSSTAAVGKVFDNGIWYVNEKNKWTQSPKTSGYAISKYSAEKEVWRAMEEGLNAVIINPSVIFGPGSWKESSLTIFQTISKGMLFYTKGANAFVDVRDVVKSMVSLMDATISNERFLCTGNNTTFKNLFDLIANNVKTKAPFIFANKFMCEIAWRLASLISVFTRKKATLTKESVESSQNITIYSSQKLVDTLNLNFIPLEDTVKFTIQGRI